MSKRPTVNEEQSGGGAPVWMLTYADTVTLLMTFFVMLISFSTINEDEFSRVRGALVGYLGMSGRPGMNYDSFLPRRHLEASRVHLDGYENPPEHVPLSYVVDQFRMNVRKTSVVNVLNYKMTRQGFEISIQPGALFEPGESALNAEAPRVLEVIARACRHLPNSLRVHAEADTYFSLDYAEPEPLARDRALTVCAWLNSHGRIRAHRLAPATGIGEAATPLGGEPQGGVRITVMKTEADGAS